MFTNLKNSLSNSHTGISAYVQTAKSPQIRLLWPLCALINDIYLLTYCIYVTETDQFDTELVAVVLGDLESRQSGRVLIVDEIRAASQQQLEWLGLVVTGTHVERRVPILHPTTQLLTAGTSRHVTKLVNVRFFLLTYRQANNTVFHDFQRFLHKFINIQGQSIITYTFFCILYSRQCLYTDAHI